MCMNTRESVQERETRERGEAAQLYRESIAGMIENVAEPDKLEYFYYFIRAKLGLEDVKKIPVYNLRAMSDEEWNALAKKNRLERKKKTFSGFKGFLRIRK